MCVHEEYRPGCEDCRRDGDEEGAWATLRSSLATAEREVAASAESYRKKCEEGQKWAERFHAAERARDEARAEVARLTRSMDESAGALAGDDTLIHRLTGERDEAVVEVKRLTRAINLFTENYDNAAGKANALSFALLKRAEAAEAKVATLEKDLADTRASHARLAKGVKTALGLENWPTIEGNFADGVGKLVADRLSSMCTVGCGECDECEAVNAKAREKEEDHLGVEVHTCTECPMLPPHRVCWEDASGMNRWSDGKEKS